MKFTLALLATAFSHTSASPIERSVEVDEFCISNVEAYCKPKNGGCYWSFDLVEPPSTSTIHCEGSIADVQVFPASIGFQPCSNPAIIFQFHYFDNIGEYRFTIADLGDDKNPVYGAKVWKPADFPVITDGSGTYQVYTGDKAFNISPLP